MLKYLIKRGQETEGPFTYGELYLLKLKPTTLIKRSDSQLWVEARQLPELKHVVRKNNSTFYGTAAILSLVVIISLVYGIRTYLINTNSNENSQVIEEIIPPPPDINFQLSRHRKKLIREIFKGCNINGDKKELINSCNFTNTVVRNTAVKIAGNSSGTYNLGQICDIFDYAYNGWNYVQDPKSIEIIEAASSTIQNGLNGDCDDFAVLICSMILAIGGEARINYAFNQKGGHAFTEVNIGKPNLREIENYIAKRYKLTTPKYKVQTKTDKEGNLWLNLDWFANYPGGDYFNYSHGTTFYILQKYCVNFEAK